jgi:hypothetical protein
MPRDAGITQPREGTDKVQHVVVPAICSRPGLDRSVP